MSTDRPVATKLPAGPLPCTLAPAGWVCTREADHEPPCAAVPAQPLPLDELPVAGPARPGPGARVTRTAGQIGATTVLIDLWFAFGWLGSDSWTADQAAMRWPAITAASVFVVAAVQNLAGWWRERQGQT